MVSLRVHLGQKHPDGTGAAVSLYGLRFHIRAASGFTRHGRSPHDCSGPELTDAGNMPEWLVMLRSLQRILSGTVMLVYKIQQKPVAHSKPSARNTQLIDVPTSTSGCVMTCFSRNGFTLRSCQDLGMD